jgi:hypothetical protein
MPTFVGLDGREGWSNHSLIILGSSDKALLVIPARERRRKFISALHQRADPIFTDLSLAGLHKKYIGHLQNILLAHTKFASPRYRGALGLYATQSVSESPTPHQARMILVKLHLIAN